MGHRWRQRACYWVCFGFTDAPNDSLYVSGDTVWYEGIEEIAGRFNITAAVFFMGAAT